MLLRNGNKQSIAKNIIPYFPGHDIYIEPFFGAGGMFFNKLKVKYNFVNDYNKDVFNLFMILKNQCNEFYDAFSKLPVDQNLFNYWKLHQETEPINKALRFVYLNNFSHRGQGSVLSLLPRNVKNSTLRNIPNINLLLQNVIITSLDFEKFLNSLWLESNDIKVKTFIYADPPYINKFNNYELSWTELDTERLFETLKQLNIRFAISETESDLILDLAKYYKLHITEIIELKRLSSIRTELLITNYKV